MAMNQSYKNQNYPYQIEDALETKRFIKFFLFSLSVKAYQIHGKRFILPSPSKNMSVLGKALEIEGR